MAFCGNCGAQINDGAKFCPVCGSVQGAQAAPNQQQQQSAPAQSQAYARMRKNTATLRRFPILTSFS